MDFLTQVAPEFHKLSFHLWDTDDIFINSITDSTRYIQCNQRFIHCVELYNVELYGRVYIEKTDSNSGVQQVFHKSTRTKLKVSFITHIEGDPVFSTKDSETKLEQLFIISTYHNFMGWQERPTMINLSSLITFAPEKKLLDAKVNHKENYPGDNN